MCDNPTNIMIQTHPSNPSVAICQDCIKLWEDRTGKRVYWRNELVGALDALRI
jgi:hypothetical protein